MRLWPFTRKAETPEQKSLASPDAAMEALFGVSPSSHGIPVSQLQALKVPVVANAIQLISEAVASLDVHVKRIDGDAEIDVPDHPVLDLLRNEANEWTTGFELIRQLVADALISDAGGLAWVNRINGEAREIIRYRQNVLAFDVDMETGERKYLIANRAVPARDVIHLLPPLGRSPMTLALDAIGIAIALDRHAGRLFTRGAKPSGALKFPKGIGEEAVKKIRAAWRSTHEAEDSGGQTVILYDGTEFEPFTFTSTDAQFLENRRFQIEEIARAFNIPAPMVGDLSRATWSNSEQKGREFLSYTLEPWLRGLEGAFRRALLNDAERQTHIVRFDRDDLTRADLSTRATVINSLIASQTINPNEGRAWIGLPPRDGGDEFRNPNIETGGANPETETGNTDATE
ncbi:phage portal protein [Paracoccus sp. Z330]|uniref:Phage portal protein n=1 Tax=Paracoccus onchidii TaxID=3017813 RepID=A0ABT4ZJK6_9RHOB|nr:phage portal protein [Paracoccus onchidii]MDB6179545.1 phage portal protein [Paracoccus onchidii]